MGTRRTVASEIKAEIAMEKPMVVVSTQYLSKSLAVSGFHSAWKCVPHAKAYVKVYIMVHRLTRTIRLLIHKLRPSFQCVSMTNMR